MSKKITTSVLGLLLVMAFSSWKKSPAPSDPCKDMLKAVYDKFYSTKPEAGHIYYLSYDVRSVLREKEFLPGKLSKPEDGIMHVKILSSSDQVRFSSGRVQVLMDKDEIFTIIPSEKTIYWTGNPTKAMTGAGMNDRYKSMQDSLLSISVVTACENVSAGGADKKIVLEPRGKKAKYYGAQSLTYFIDTKNMSIKKVKIAYLPSNDIDYVEYTFNDVSYDYKEENLNQSIQDIVLHKHKPAAAYTGYKLIDKRNTKKL